MAKENEGAQGGSEQEEKKPQEGDTTGEEELELDENQADEDEESAEDTVTLPKSEFTKMKRKAIAYDSKGKPARQKLPAKNEEIESIRKDVSDLKLERQKRQFGFEHGLSPDETDKIFQLNPNPTKETLEDEFVKAGLAAIRAKKRVAANTPGSSASAPRFAPGKKRSEMTSAEKQAAHEEFMKDKFGRR